MNKSSSLLVLMSLYCSEWDIPSSYGTLLIYMGHDSYMWDMTHRDLTHIHIHANTQIHTLFELFSGQLLLLFLSFFLFFFLSFFLSFFDKYTPTHTCTHLWIISWAASFIPSSPFFFFRLQIHYHFRPFIFHIGWLRSLGSIKL